MDEKDILSEYKKTIDVIKKMCVTIQTHPMYDRVDFANIIEKTCSELQSKTK